jgi:deoxyribonuclease V
LRWPYNIISARRLQQELSEKVRIEPLRKGITTVAGADAAYFKDRIIVAICLFKFNNLELLEEVSFTEKVRFPYIPGLLSFREGPAILKATKKLSTRPDLMLFDGHGICHPQRLGIASHMGVLLNIPTIGCAKSILTGRYSEPGPEKGSFSYIYVDTQIRGICLRTRDNTRPLFISPGHLINFEDTMRIVLDCCKGFRTPEPLRRAHTFSKIIKNRLYG